MSRRCRNPCPESCGIGADCTVINHEPLCSCPFRYTGNPHKLCEPSWIHTYNKFAIEIKTNESVTSAVALEMAFTPVALSSIPNQHCKCCVPSIALPSLDSCRFSAPFMVDDVALVILSRPVQYNDSVAPICISTFDMRATSISATGREFDQVRTHFFRANRTTQ